MCKRLGSIPHSGRWAPVALDGVTRRPVTSFGPNAVRALSEPRQTQGSAS